MKYDWGGRPYWEIQGKTLKIIGVEENYDGKIYGLLDDNEKYFYLFHEDGLEIIQ